MCVIAAKKGQPPVNPSAVLQACSHAGSMLTIVGRIQAVSRTPLRSADFNITDGTIADLGAHAGALQNAVEEVRALLPRCLRLAVLMSSRSTLFLDRTSIIDMVTDFGPLIAELNNDELRQAHEEQHRLFMNVAATAKSEDEGYVLRSQIVAKCLPGLETDGKVRRFVEQHESEIRHRRGKNPQHHMVHEHDFQVAYDRDRRDRARLADEELQIRDEMKRQLRDN